MRKQMSIRKCPSTRSCNICGRSNYKQHGDDDRIYTIYELTIGSSVVALCNDCLRDLKNLLNPPETILEDYKLNHPEDDKLRQDGTPTHCPDHYGYDIVCECPECVKCWNKRLKRDEWR